MLVDAADRAGRQRLARPGRRGRQRRRARRGRAVLAAAGVPHVLADNVVPRIGVLAPESARAAIREMFLAHVIGGKHLSKRADFTDDGAAARRRTSCSPASSCCPRPDEADRARRRGRRRRRRRDDRRALASSRSTPNRARRGLAPARWWRPPRSPGPSRATSACAGQRVSTVAAARAGRPDGGGRAPARRPGVPPRHRGRGATSTRRSPAPRSALALRRHAGRSRWWSAPRAGSSSAPARTCARSTCWSARAGSCATGAPASWTGSWPAAPATRGRVAAAARATGRGRHGVRAGRGGLLAAAAPRGGVRAVHDPLGLQPRLRTTTSLWRVPPTPARATPSRSPGSASSASVSPSRVPPCAVIGPRLCLSPSTAAPRTSAGPRSRGPWTSPRPGRGGSSSSSRPGWWSSRPSRCSPSSCCRWSSRC